MADTIRKSIVVYSANVYLEAIPAGSRIPTSGDMCFPVQLDSEPFFHLQVGQMAGQTPDEADFEHIAELYLDQFPAVQESALDIWVVLHLTAEKELYVEIRFTPVNREELLQDSLVYGPFPVT